MATTVAQTNRSLRNIQNELLYLTESGTMSQEQMQSILNILPATITPNVQRAPSPVHIATNTPVDTLSNINIKEQHYPDPVPTPLPPPAYPAEPSTLSVATALYVYTPTDNSDLALLVGDVVQVWQYMNADWWRGKNCRSGFSGLFPRAYVKVTDEKNSPTYPSPTEYGNMPLAVADGSQLDPNQRKTSKLEEHGKKFGKKMGNAAIFGAGATIGSNIVNGIF